MTNIYFIKDHKTCENIDQVENEIDDVYLTQVLSEYVKNKFKILPIYTQKTEFEIANDINLKNGIFVTKNFRVYKKMENVNKGYLYNSYSNICEYLGCIVMINDSKIVRCENKITEDLSILTDKINNAELTDKINNAEQDFLQNIYFEAIDTKIPMDVTHLTFGDDFNQPIKGCIPSSVTHLTFGDDFNQPIKGCIPLSVTHLIFGFCFNQDIKHCIPSGVTHLTFGDCFNQPIKGCIPSSVTHLTFGDYFNQPIKGCIPLSVTHLIFGFCFNQDIKHCIPSGVTHLTFGNCFNQNIKDCIPSSVKYLSF